MGFVFVRRKVKNNLKIVSSTQKRGREKEERQIGRGGIERGKGDKEME